MINHRVSQVIRTVLYLALQTLFYVKVKRTSHKQTVCPFHDHQMCPIIEVRHLLHPQLPTIFPKPDEQEMVVQ